MAGLFKKAYSKPAKKPLKIPNFQFASRLKI